MMPGSLSPPPKQPSAKWPGFLINRSGLPFDDLTWNELWQFAVHLYPEAAPTFKEIQGAPSLPDVSYPTPPGTIRGSSGYQHQHHQQPTRVYEHLTRTQDYLNRLTYNHTGTQFFETRPGSSMLSLMELARTMVREALPIKCMEAVVLAVYLTNGVTGLGRFTINFKSELPASSRLQHQGANNARSNRRYFYHVVLGISLGNKFGSLGLSRRVNLMDKPVSFPSLYELLLEFEQSYRDCGQKLVKVRIGQLITHDPYSISPIPWKGITIHPRADDPADVKAKVDKYSKELKSYLRGFK